MDTDRNNDNIVEELLKWLKEQSAKAAKKCAEYQFYDHGYYNYYDGREEAFEDAIDKIKELNG